MALLVNTDRLIENKTLVVILGPTASGKTAAALELSAMIPVEIISADSRQVFRYLDIGTAKPTQKELDSVKHHFIDIVNPDEYFSAGMFGQEASDAAQSILKRGRIPVVAGGSGLYIRSLCEGFFTEDNQGTPKHEVRQLLDNKLTEQGIDALYNELVKADPMSAEKYSDRNPRRILRALEYYYQYGKPFSSAHNESKAVRDFNVVYFGLDLDRQELYRRINLRAELMWKTGIIEETKAILDRGYSRTLNALNTVGYKECIMYLDNVLPELQALDKMKQSTRNYAKRQLTWFRKIGGVRWLRSPAKDTARKIYTTLSEL